MSKRTPLFDSHVKMGAKIVPFGGWDMPVFYPGGIISEHNAVRTSAGIFDIGHMGAVTVKGPNALQFIQKVFTNDSSLLNVGDAQYSLILNENGGVMDDVFVYRLPGYYLVVLNASNNDKDIAWLKKNLIGGAEMTDIKERTTLLALQGPKAQEILQKVCSFDLKSLGHHKITESQISNFKSLISRTGYTGEDGFELFFDRSEAASVWEKLLSLGAAPAGLGARDTLRLEAGMPLYGHEYDETITPLETPFMFAVKLNKGEFIGRKALLSQKERGAEKKLVGLRLDKGSIPRQGYKIFRGGNLTGTITSGTLSPTLNFPIGMGFVRTVDAAQGQRLQVEIRDKMVHADVVKLPFYKRSGV